jgi:hypothetical protein
VFEKWHADEGDNGMILKDFDKSFESGLRYSRGSSKPSQVIQIDCLDDS